MITDRDVTDLVQRGSIDDEVMPISKCVCGAEFPDWKFYISIYRDTPYHCPSCNRGLYFSMQVRVYEVAEK